MKNRMIFALAVLLGYTQAQQEIALDCAEKVDDVQEIAEEIK